MFLELLKPDSPISHFVMVSSGKVAWEISGKRIKSATQILPLIDTTHGLGDNLTTFVAAMKLLSENPEEAVAIFLSELDSTLPERKSDLASPASIKMLPGFNTEHTWFIRTNKRAKSYIICDGESGEWQVVPEHCVDQIFREIFPGRDLARQRQDYEDARTRSLIEIFDPSSPPGIDETRGTFNTYTQPPYVALGPSKTALVDSFFKYYRYLIPTDTERDDVSTWVGRLLRGDANEEALCLIGLPGVGKTFFYQVVSALVGKRFCLSVGRYGLSRFNGPLVDKCLAFLDELNIPTLEALDQFKFRLSRGQTVMFENKGQDAFASTNNCNYMIANNGPERVFMLPTERKFICPTLANKSYSEYLVESELILDVEPIVKAQIELFRDIATLHTEESDSVYTALHFLRAYFLSVAKKREGDQLNVRMPLFYEMCMVHTKGWQRTLLISAKNDIDQISAKASFGNGIKNRKDASEARVLLDTFNAEFKPLMKSIGVDRFEIVADSPLDKTFTVQVVRL